MNAHTPGPWMADMETADGGQTVSIIAEDQHGRWVVASVNQCMGTESRQNARLIAAAPDLLAALRDFVDYVSPGADVPLAAMLAEARAAIAKAAVRMNASPRP